MEAEIARRIRQALPDAQVRVAVEGNRARIEVISRGFDGLSRVRRHQKVYGCINALIADGRLHAVSIDAAIPAEP